MGGIDLAAALPHASRNAIVQNALEPRCDTVRACMCPNHDTATITMSRHSHATPTFYNKTADDLCAAASAPARTRAWLLRPGCKAWPQRGADSGEAAAP